MNSLMSFGTQTGMSKYQSFTGQDFNGSVLQTMIDILNQPRVKQCAHCNGHGLVTAKIVCSCCKGYGRTP